MKKRREGKRSKPPILRWYGLLADRSRFQRRTVFGVLAALVVTLTFTQFGLMHVTISDEGDAYLVLLLVPMALAAMALGTGAGLLMGVISGAVLALHAVVQPLSYYEVIAVTPNSALLIFGLTGAALGLFFALALRKGPKGHRRRLRVVLLSLLVAVGFSAMFVVNATLQVTMDIAMRAGESFDAEVALARIFVGVARLGDPILQILLDTLLMSFVCILADSLLRYFWPPADQSPLQSMFRMWLLLVVALGFMLVSTVSYVMITSQEFGSAQTKMQGEIHYLDKQLAASDVRREFLSHVETKAEDVLSEEDQIRLAESYSVDSLMQGYDRMADGTVIIASGTDPDAVVVASNDEVFAVGSRLDEVMSDISIDSIVTSSETNALVRVVYDRSYSAYEELPTNWRIVAEIGYLLAQETGDYVTVMIRPSAMVYAERSIVAMWVALATFVLLGLVFAMVSLLLKRMVVGPVATVDSGLDAICAGELETVVDARGSIEMCSLSDGINTTVGTLKGLIAESERRMHQDLVTAQTIQESALPSTFPPFPDVHEFDIYASMDAAREVGGDFYDFFLINDHTLGFLIADVSGKGIPGALFMMKAKAELDNYIQTGMGLAEAIQTANYRLCEGNDAGMFVTVWAAILDFRSGALTYVNAGHNPPLLRHEGAWTWLDNRSGLFMGTFEKAKYKSFELRLALGDALLLYTDGVNEAFNTDEEEYGNARLEEFLCDHATLHPREVVTGLRASVAKWATGAEQSDDITILALEYGSAPLASSKLVVPAEISHLEEVIDFVDAELAGRLCPLGVQRRVDIALEELFVNVCQHAYSGSSEVGECEVEYVYTTNPNAITVTISDSGVPFDPLEQSQSVDILDAVEQGGLGIAMVKHNVDDLSYVRDGDRNIVAFSKRW